MPTPDATPSSSAPPSALPSPLSPATVLGDDGPFSVAVQAPEFELGVEVARLRGWPEVALAGGAVASFVGHVRAADARDAGPVVESLTLEHYPGMTERAIAAMIDEARRRFAVLGVRVVHRVGRLGPGEPIVVVVTASPHRRDAFESCEFLMDYLKTQAPFWKKEATAEGERWVDARVADDEALARWGIAATNATPDATQADTVPAPATMPPLPDMPPDSPTRTR